jgi:hypothetical protein
LAEFSLSSDDISYPIFLTKNKTNLKPLLI